MINKTWWKESVIYQIYPRSFNDSDGDGIGDLKGVIEKLDYLKDLGVDIVWLSPFYQSPNDDNGYDISNYYEIMKEFGTMEDFDNLLAGMKERGIRMIIDLVVNHSSDEHDWFQEARKSKDNPYRDYYIWKPALDGKEPNDWVSFFSGSAWEFDEQTQEYYLHYFTKKQPDLNWENEKLRQEIYKMMRFWLDKGVSGFRLDVIPLISKKTDFPNYPEGFTGDFPTFYASGPRLHEFLQEMHREVLGHYDVMTVGEGIGVTPAEVNDYVGEDRKELSMIFHFGHMFFDRQPDNFLAKREATLPEFKDIFMKWEEGLGDQGWGSIYLGNHDFPRMVTRFGSDSDEFRTISAKMLATTLFTLKGTPYIYQGDEIGMTNVAYDSIEDYNDVQSLNAYKEWVANGGDANEYFKIVQEFSRDNARTPIQWDSSENAGFTTGKPWLKVNSNYPKINVEVEEAEENSILNYYKNLTRFRKANPVLIYGETKVIDKDHLKVYAYLRIDEHQKMLVVHNYSDSETEYHLPNLEVASNQIKISNYAVLEAEKSNVLSLRPYESRVYEL